RSYSAPHGARRRSTSGRREELSVLQHGRQHDHQHRDDLGKGMKRARPDSPPIRILSAVPICDGNDSAINTINLELIRHGIEVVYLGYHRSADDIVRAAVQEDVRAIGISSYNGGHVEFFSEVLAELRARNGRH